MKKKKTPRTKIEYPVDRSGDPELVGLIESKLKSMALLLHDDPRLPSRICNAVRTFLVSIRETSPWGSESKALAVAALRALDCLPDGFDKDDA